MIKLKGRQAPIDEHEFLRWLNSKKPNSVRFACFGGTGELEFSQVMEIAIGL
jgi:plastocyanin domain-containing protein